MNKPELISELEKANPDATLIWHNTKGSRNDDDKEHVVQRILIDKDDILLVGNEFVFNPARGKAKTEIAIVKDLLGVLLSIKKYNLVWHDVKEGEEFEIKESFFDKRRNDFLLIGNPYPEREGPSLIETLEADPEKFKRLLSLFCKCEICESGKSCSGPARPLTEEDIASLNRSAPRDDGPCGGCGKHVQYFSVVINGYRCPECNGPESNIDWSYHLREDYVEGSEPPPPKLTFDFSRLEKGDNRK